MNKTKIEWCDYTLNPVKGYCPMGCEYCYARRMYDRFGWDKTIRFDLGILKYPDKPSRIFVGSTMELFGEWIEDEWMNEVFQDVYGNPEHTFIFLTKKPENLAKWNPWPDNAWVGATHDGTKGYLGWTVEDLLQVDSSVRFVSFEPLQRGIYGLDFIYDLDWIIIGAETGNRKYKPTIDQVHRWTKDILETVDIRGGIANIPVFLKDNLKWPVVRREFPK